MCFERRNTPTIHMSSYVLICLVLFYHVQNVIITQLNSIGVYYCTLYKQLSPGEKWVFFRDKCACSTLMLTLAPVLFGACV